MLAGWRSRFVADPVHSRLRVRARPKSVDSHGSENRQRPCRMTMRQVKDPLSACLTWILSVKLSSLSAPSGEETEHQNYIAGIGIPPIGCHN
ncbi:hypothetical protein TNCV_2947151 [Trichonephila clavipes]|nr:hypothetical protein TNCV_2947151 [Trichonephila clavipes]